MDGWMDGWMDGFSPAKRFEGVDLVWKGKRKDGGGRFESAGEEGSNQYIDAFGTF